jgi:hypothetical protein
LASLCASSYMSSNGRLLFFSNAPYFSPRYDSVYRLRDDQYIELQSRATTDINRSFSSALIASGYA